MATRDPAIESVLVAEESYRRCGGEPFFQAFYKRLLESDPTIPPKFAATDFDRQSRLLQHGIGLLLIFAKRPNPTLLSRIAERHASHDLDIAPAMYPHFVESLLATVREYDPRCTSDVEEAWRAAVAPGIAHMAGRHAG
jgi:hemoglobin-like flavoprotein